MPMPTPRQVVDWFAWRAGQDEDAITHLKAQKLLYYAQGFHLAHFNEPLVDCSFKAWEHGPVVGELYYELKQFGTQSLSVPDHDVSEPFTADQIELLAEVYDTYGRFSAWRLRDLTHSEPPWLQARANNQDRISAEDMKAYFATQVE